ncbi:MAG: MYG1 family protein [Bacteroidales bacterium]|nr:MYG1 family protein [Bacteroidales bacterium]
MTESFPEKSENKVTVVTHNGIFHADEVFAIALISCIHGKLEVVRTRDKKIIDQAKSDPKIFVIDVGMVSDPRMKCFDHHQQSQSGQEESSVSLVFRYLFDNQATDPVLSLVYDRLIREINDWDTGKIGKHINSSPVLLPRIISGYNRADDETQDKQFIKVVNLAREIVRNEFNTSKLLVQGKKIWDRRIRLSESSVILNEFCPFWRQIQAGKKLIPYILQPVTGGWAVMSADSDTYPLPEPEESENIIFFHPAKFYALFNTRSEAHSYLDRFEPGNL